MTTRQVLSGVQSVVHTVEHHRTVPYIPLHFRRRAHLYLPELVRGWGYFQELRTQLAEADSAVFTMGREVGLFELPTHDVVFPHILSHLNVLEVWRCRAVCTKFLALCNEFFRTATTLDLRPYREHLQRYSGIFLRILRTSVQVKNFYLRGLNCSSVLPATLAGQHQALVTALCSSGRGTPANFRVLSLENVDLPHIHTIMAELGRHCTQLEELTLSSIIPFDDESLELITAECRGLKRLTLINLPIRGHSLLKLASNNTATLKHLGVSYCSYIKPAHLEETFKTCSKLQSVDLRYSGTASDRTVRVLAEFCQDLGFLMVEGCAGVTEQVLIPLRRRGMKIDIGYKEEKPVAWHRQPHARFLRIPGQI